MRALATILCALVPCLFGCAQAEMGGRTARAFFTPPQHVDAKVTRPVRSDGRLASAIPSV